MAYIPDATNFAEPVDGEPATTAALEFRTLKQYIHNVILAGLGAKFDKTGGTLTGGLVVRDFLGVVGAATGIIDIKRPIKAAGQVSLNFTSLDTGAIWQLFLQSNSDDIAFYSNVLGANVATFNILGDSYFRRDVNVGRAVNVGGTVYATRFVGDGSGITNLPGGTITQGEVLAAIGYTPYNATNPASYISGITNGMVLGALGFTPYPNSNPSNFINGVSGSMINSALGFTVGTNAKGNKTISTAAPSGVPADGDLWYQYIP